MEAIPLADLSPEPITDIDIMWHCLWTSRNNWNNKPYVRSCDFILHEAMDQSDLSVGLSSIFMGFWYCVTETIGI